MAESYPSLGRYQQLRRESPAARICAHANVVVVPRKQLTFNVNKIK